MFEATGNIVNGFDIDKQGFRNYYFADMANIMFHERQSLSTFLLDADAVKIQSALKSKFGLVSMDMIKDFITAYLYITEHDD